MSEQKYEYLVTFRDLPRGLLLGTPRGRHIKQTREAADRLVSWARNRGYKVVVLQRRAVGDWEEV